MLTGSKELIRSINSNLILESIIRYQPISRAALSKMLGLTKATISAVVAELMEQQLVLEIGSDETTYGRKPILLNFNRKSGYAISLLIDDNTVSALLTDLLGEVYTFQEISVNQKSDNLEESILKAVKSLNAYAPKCHYGLIGITLVVFDSVYQNILIDPPSSRYQYLNLREKLEQAFHIPVFLENEASMSVLAEHTLCHKDDNICALNIHSKINLGIIINGRLYHGAGGMAGRISNLCCIPCDNEGSAARSSMDSPLYQQNLYKYLIENSMLLEYRRYKHNARLSLSDLIQSYRQDDPFAYNVIKKFTDYLGWCVNSVIVMYNPSVIVIGCNVLDACPELLHEIRIKVPLVYRENTLIHVSSIQPSSSLLGGIYLAVEQFLKLERFHVNLNFREQ